MTFTTVDYLLVGLYFALVQYIGFAAARRRAATGAEESAFILDGRRLTLPLFIATLVATWYGSILGVGEFVYTSGIVAWVCFGLPYYLAAAGFAWMLAAKIRTMKAETIPDHFARAYGPRAGVFASLLVLVITIPAPYMLMLGVLIRLFTGWSLPLCIGAGAVLSVVYLYRGGFRADVYTNVLQFVLMYAGFGLLTAFAVATYGAPSVMVEHLPAAHLDPAGGNSWQYVAVWFIIALQTFVDPSFHQRCAAARTPAVARRGVLISIGFWMVFDAMTLLCGLYARAFVPEIEPLMSYPLLAESVLPTALRGVFMVALLATVMSTLESYGFLSAVTLGRDIGTAVAQRLGRVSQEGDIERRVRWGIVGMAAASVGMAVLLPSVVQLIYVAASVAVPGLLAPLVVGYTERLTLPAARLPVVMGAPPLVAVLWIAVREYAPALWPLLAEVAALLEPMVAGLISSLFLTLAFLQRRVAV